MQLALGPSRRLGALLGTGHAAAALLAAWALPGLWPVPAFVALGISGLIVWRTHVARSAAGAVVGIELTPPGVLLHYRDGRSEPAGLAGGTVLPWLVVLKARPIGQRRTVSLVLLPDATGREAHRRARVWLKWATSRTDNHAAL